MNYLAHLALADSTPESLTGNLLGDFMRGVDKSALPAEILEGLERHRMVDRITDADPGVKSLRPLMSDKRRRFSGIISDVAFDYYLIKHWTVFYDQPLDDFIDITYQHLLASRDQMPERMAFVVTRICEENWLAFYATLNGVGTALDNMSRRMRFDNHLTGAQADIERNYQAFEESFLNLYPKLIEASTSASPVILHPTQLDTD